MGWNAFGGAVAPYSGCAPTHAAGLQMAQDFVKKELETVIAINMSSNPDWDAGFEQIYLVMPTPGDWAYVDGKLFTRDYSDKRKGKCDGPSSPRAGNPIELGLGNKFQIETDYRAPNGVLGFHRYYNSLGDGVPALGPGWSHSYSRRLEFGAGDAPTVVHYTADDGRATDFRAVSGAWVASDVDRSTLVQYPGGWLIYHVDNRIDMFDINGRLLSTSTSSGQVIQMQYSADGRLVSASDQFGRSLTLEYDAGVRLSRVTTPGGLAITYLYRSLGSTSGLAAVVFGDGKSRSYQYNNSLYLVALTDLIDENGDVFASWSYDDRGRAVSSQHAGGVELTRIAFGANQATVTLPNGIDNVVDLKNVRGLALQTSQSQPAGSGCAGASRAYTYDVNGNKASADDFNGVRTCFAYDLGRNIETVRVEGLANSEVCSVITSLGVPLPTNSRKVSVEWHPDWRLETKRAEPGRLTLNVYNGQPDPFNGGVTANCAPTTSMLPGGKPLAVLCSQTEQATTDPNGAQGFSAVATGIPRTTTYSYDALGRVLTIKDANNRTTNYEYYADTSFTGVDPDAIGHTVGDLRSITNAVGHITSFSLYDRAGRLRQSVDAKGITFDTSYTPRGWVGMTTITPPGGTARSTSYYYDAVGQLKVVAQPDGSSVTYTYDPAHRLIGVKDAKGNKVAYTLDNAGNRTAEQIKDPSGTLQRSISRIFDALNRVQQISGVAQ